MLDPSEARLWAETVARLIADSEAELIYIIAQSAAKNQGAPLYATQRLAELATVRARLEKELGRSWRKVMEEAQKALDQAADAGQGAARIDLQSSGLPDTLPPQVALGVEQIAADTIRQLTTLRAVVLRQAVDAYQQIMAGPVAQTVLGSTTRLQATQLALTRFARHGITGFTDKGGRQWTMGAYAEMATRTGAIGAMRSGYEQTLIFAGEDLVMVTSHGYTCAKCGPWEGKILSLTGRTPTGRNRLPHTTRDSLVTVRVAGTLTEAKSAGLFHPNCAHSYALYLPGVSRTATPGNDLETYNASQEQRGLEREIRQKKRELAASVTPVASSTARSEIRALQAQIRELNAKYPKLTRKRVREQIKTAH